MPIVRIPYLFSPLISCRIIKFARRNPQYHSRYKKYNRYRIITFFICEDCVAGEISTFWEYAESKRGRGTVKIIYLINTYNAAL
jgi:hypothetical protein